MNSLGKYVLTKTQKIVLLVVVFALIAGGYYAGFYLPVQRRIEAADTAELDAQIQLEQMKAMQIRQMEEEIEEKQGIECADGSSLQSFQDRDGGTEPYFCECV